jgi:hypothetical protein
VKAAEDDPPPWATTVEHDPRRRRRHRAAPIVDRAIGDAVAVVVAAERRGWSAIGTARPPGTVEAPQPSIAVERGNESSLARGGITAGPRALRPWSSGVRGVGTPSPAEHPGEDKRGESPRERREWRCTSHALGYPAGSGHKTGSTTFLTARIAGASAARLPGDDETREWERRRHPVRIGVDEAHACAALPRDGTSTSCDRPARCRDAREPKAPSCVRDLPWPAAHADRSLADRAASRRRPSTTRRSSPSTKACLVSRLFLTSCVGKALLAWQARAL